MFWVLYSKGMFQFAFRKNINAMEKTKTSSPSSSSDNKNKLCRCDQGAKRKLKDVVSNLEYKSMCPCLQAVKSYSNSCGCIGCKNPFVKNQGEDPPIISSVKRMRRKHSLTAEAGMKYLQIDHKKTHWSIIKKSLLEEIANSLSQRYNKLTLIIQLYITESETGKKTCITTKTLNNFRSKISHLVNYSRVCQKRLVDQGQSHLNCN